MSGRRRRVLPLLALLSLEALAGALGSSAAATALQVASLALSVLVVVRLVREPEDEPRVREQLQANLAIAQAAEERLRLAFTATSEFIWDTDLRTGVMHAAPQIGAWLGYPPDAFPPKPWHLIVHPEDRQRVVDGIAAALRNPAARYESRHRFIHVDGKQVFHVRVTGVTTTDEQGRPVRFLGAVRDITAEVEAESQRLQAQKLESLGLLAGGIAHDFNNLLTVISSSLDLADRLSQRGAPPTEPLATASSALGRATTLTRQLLAYTGKSPVQHRPVELNELVGAMGQLLAVSIPPKVRLVRALATSLPRVKGDEGQLQQVVMNLITNAAEAIGPRDGSVTLATALVQLTAQPPGVIGVAPLGDVVKVSVADDGAGMSPEVQARIFDPFFSTKGPGRGLGLSALAGILKAHGGAIALESEVGRGTTFAVYLPALDDLHERPAVKPVSEGPLPACRVLVVDDEALLRRSASRLLTALGCAVEVAETGRLAVELLRANPSAFDVVLMDLTMPELDGLEASRSIRTFAPALPIILSSGYSVDLPDLARVTLLAKPYTSAALERALRLALATAEQPGSP